MSTALEMAKCQIAEFERWKHATALPDRPDEWPFPETRYTYWSDLMLARWIVEQSEAAS